MLMVVFGAGASFDSSPDYPPDRPFGERPPLANDLFIDIPGGAYRAARNRFPQFHAIIGQLLPRGRPKWSIEDVLQKFQDEAEQNPDRHGQLLAVKYYLASLF